MVDRSTAALPEYLARLDENQRAAAMDTDGYVAIHACAGAGKTAVLAARVAYLLDSGVPPGRVMCITFTNKAADEMHSRIRTYVGHDTSQVQIGTYHAICAGILREYGSVIGTSSDFTICDEEKSRMLVRRVLKQHWIDTKQVKQWTNKIQRLKCQQLDDEDRQIQLECEHGKEHTNRLFQIHRSYQSHLKNSNALDFGDLISDTVRLLSSYPDVLSEVSGRYHYICVDEYQDSSRIEADLLRLLSSYHGNLCVVGDIRQSIYSFKGSDYRLILDFVKTYLGVKTHVLHVNYRCARRIVDTAEHLISGTTIDPGYRCITNRKDAGEVVYLRFASDTEEAEVIARAADELIATGMAQYSDIAVLSRVRSVLVTAERMLRRYSISCVSTAPEWLQSPEVKCALSYLRLTVDPDDHVSLCELTQCVGGSNRRLGQIHQTVSVLRGMYLCGVQLRSLLRVVFELVRRDLTLDSLNSLSKLETEASKYTGRVQDAIHAVLEGLSQADAVDRDDAVRLMTIHESKGLQFKVVYIIGLDDGVLPCWQATGDEDALEEERRLLYVAMTRATNYLCLCSSQIRHRGTAMVRHDVSRLLTCVASP